MATSWINSALEKRKAETSSQVMLSKSEINSENTAAAEIIGSFK